MDKLAARCFNASGAELAAVCNRAALSALRRAVQACKSDEAPNKLTVLIEQHDFDEVIAEMFGKEGEDFR